MSSADVSDRKLRQSIRQTVQASERLNALRRYDILDTEPEPAFDRIASLASCLMDTPIAIVNFIDDDRQWFKSAIGIEETETALDVSFCIYTVERGDLTVVEDLAEDDRFAGNPYVTEHGVRFYAGAPLITPDEERIGTLCVLDTEPRSPSDEALAGLSDLAAMVVDELELRRRTTDHRNARAQLAESRELLQHAQGLAKVGAWAYDPQTDGLAWTDETYRIHDLPVDAPVDVERAFAFYTPESQRVLRSQFNRLLNEGGRYDVELDIRTEEGTRKRVHTIGQADRVDGETTRISGAIQDVTERHRAECLLEMQSTLFKRIAKGDPSDAIFAEVCRRTEAEFDEVVVSILGREGDCLRHVSGPSVPRAFIDAVDCLEIGSSVGTCGRAAATGEAVITEDIREDERWDNYHSLAEAAGFRSCWSIPIWGEGGDILGTFAVYGADPRTPDANEKGLMHQMAHVVSVAMSRDRRRRALRDSEERWRRLVDEHPGPIHVSVDGRYVYANRATVELLGVASVDELIGKKMRTFIPDPEWRRVEERKETVYDDQEEADLIESRIRRPDGTERAVVVRSVPIQYEGRDAAQTMMWDVTARKRQKKALERQNDLFAKAQSLADVGAWEYDCRTEESVVTEQVYRIHGLSPHDDFSTDRSLEYYHPDDRPIVRDAFARAVDAGESYDLTLRLITEGGDLRWVRTRGEPQKEDGEVVRVRGTLQDVTDRVRRVNELQDAKEAAEEADRIKAALLSNMNHEFRTPLTSIISFSELISKDPDLADDFADRILGGGKRLLQTLNTVMDFAELQSDALALTPRPVNVVGLVRSVFSEFRTRAERKPVVLTVDAPSSVRARVDEHYVSRILSHLISNAIKFTEEGEITVAVEKQEGEVMLRVSDPGKGIDPSFLPHAYDEFAQASKGYNRTHEGNGLGLTVVKALVDRMEGRLDIDSTLGEGTQVTVWLPIAEQPEEGASSAGWDLE